MNLKYYLRGLGIGIVVSTLLVGIAAKNQNETLSDEEIRQRASELGMVEASGILADEIPSAEDDEQEKAEAAPTVAPTKESEEKEAPTVAPTKAPEEKEAPTAAPTKEPEEKEAPTAAPTKKPEEKETPSPTPVKEAEEKKSEISASEMTGTVTITVKSGDGSYSVCKKLEEAGVIESAAAYDNYLYQNGYDKRIIAAVYEIPVDADEEQIARIITGKK